MAESVENVPSRSLRIPFQVPVRPLRWRVCIRNANFRTNTTYPGQVTLRAVAVGGMARDDAGAFSPRFTTTSEFPKGLRLLAIDETVADMGVGWSSDWSTEALVPGLDYLLAVGYSTNRQDVHLGMGCGWWTNGRPANATLIDDPSATRVLRLPFDIRIEYELDGSVHDQVLIGDSISAASNANFPVLESPLAIAGRAAGQTTRLYGFGGAGFREWLGPNWGDPSSLKWQDITSYGRADRVVIALGNNDIHAGADLTTLKVQLRELVNLTRERISSIVVACTVTPRTTWVGTSMEQVRTAYNTWLRTYPLNITAVADIARVVEAPSGHAPRTEMVVHDGIHFNSAGSMAISHAFEPFMDRGLDARAHL